MRNVPHADHSRHAGARLSSRQNIADGSCRKRPLSWRGVESGEGHDMNCIFVQLRCKPGTAYAVADAIYEREIASEIYSTSGEFDLLLKLYIGKDVDVGKYINDNILDIEGITRSFTTMTFKAF
jgi:DNA-binding Lrp family transcriptional regulator